MGFIKKVIIVFVLLFLFLPSANAAQTNYVKNYYDGDKLVFRVYKKSGKLYYKFFNGESGKGFYKISGHTYYLAKGRVKTSFKKSGKNLYYFSEKGIMYNKGWLERNNKKYYFGSDGKAYIGLKKIKGKNYYFDKNGVMYKSGWLTNSKGKKWYFYRNGNSAVGFKRIDKKTYYFDGNGMMKTGLVKIEGYYYYFDKDGVMATGFVKFSEGQRYFDKNGRMVVGWLSVDGENYYLDSKGYTFLGKKNISGVSYDFSTDGALKNGYKESNGKTYFYDSEGKKLVGWNEVFGVKCYFNSDGALIKKNAKKVIDVSYWQGKIDWKKVKNSDVDGAIIRLGYTGTNTLKTYVDSKFSYNIKEAKKNGLRIGVYYYGYPKNKNVAKAEANLVIKTLKKYKVKLNYPVFYDAEEASISRSKYEVGIPVFNDKVKKAGYSVGVYGNYNALVNTYLNSEKIKKYNLWVAQWSDFCDYDGKRYMWQYTSSGKVSGIKGRVDINVL